MSLRERANTVPVKASAPNLQPSATQLVNEQEEYASRQAKAKAALIGNDADSDAIDIKPLAWLNEAHYEHLKSKNALEENLMRRIEAHRAEEGVSSVA